MPKHYDQEFRIAAVKLITEQRYTYKKASESLGVTVQSLRDWKRKLEREGLIHAPANETPHEEVTLVSTQALNSPTVQNGMKDILLNHAGLWETLRAQAMR